MHCPVMMLSQSGKSQVLYIISRQQIMTLKDAYKALRTSSSDSEVLKAQKLPHP